MRRHTADDITATAKQVILLLTLCPTLRTKDPNSRWSRMTLYVTQGWEWEARCQVFAQALCLDPTCEKYQQTPEHTLPGGRIDARLSMQRDHFGESGDVQI
jgi:hypothetical protein